VFVLGRGATDIVGLASVLKTLTVTVQFEQCVLLILMVHGLSTTMIRA